MSDGRCIAIKTSGARCKGKALKNDRCRYHLTEAVKDSRPTPAALEESELDIDPTPIPMGATTEAGSWKGPRAHRLQPSSREIKMLRPVCRICEEAAGGKKYLDPNWYEVCPHDPYVSYGEKIVPQPVYEPVDPSKPDGPRRIARVEQIATIEPHPNWVSVTHGGGVNKGRGVDKALRKGYIYPQMLRSPLYPNGIRRRCQFRSCFAEDVKRFVNGWFCREQEAKLVRLSDQEQTYQVNFDQRSGKFQEDQLNAISVSA